MTTESTLGTLPFGALATDVRQAITLSVVIPALNEEDSIAAIIERIDSARAPLRAVGVSGLEIIVVDDGSQDRTAEIASSFPYVRLLKHPRNRGYGAAIKSGFAQAGGDLLCFLDADGTYPPEHLPVLCRAALDDQADIVVGSRRSGASSQMPPMRRLGNFIWSNLVSLTGNHRVVDPASGMRIIRRAALPRLYPLPDGLNFTPVMSTRAVHEKLKVEEIAIPYSERVGRSKLSIVRDGTRFLTTIVWTALEYNPARILGAVGLAALAAAGMIVLSIVAMRLQGITTLGPWGVFSVFSALVLAVGGVSIFSLGATFNYLVALFHREPARPIGAIAPSRLVTIDHHFGWLGLVAAIGGSILAIICLVLGLQGWDIARLWFWLVGSALTSLVGLQLLVSWVLMRVLEGLSERDGLIQQEMAAFQT